MHEISNWLFLMGYAIYIGVPALMVGAAGALGYLAAGMRKVESRNSSSAQTISIPELIALKVEDGTVFKVRNGMPETIRDLAQRLRELHPQKRFLIVDGDIETLDESQMNEAGWYRK